MHISFQTKATTAVSLTTGLVTAYFAPKRWMASFVIGVIVANIIGSDQFEKAKGHEKFFRDIAIKDLNGSSLPGLTTAALNIVSCSLMVYDYALPVIMGISLNTVAIVGAGFLVGYTLRKFAYLKGLEEWVNGQRDDYLKRELVSQLNGLFI